MFQTKISNPILECFSHRKKERLAANVVRLTWNRKKKRWLGIASRTARDKYRVKRGTPRVNSLRESRKFAENAVARAPPAPGLIDG